MHIFTKSLKSFFEAHTNPRNAGPMKKYMRDQFEFLGIKSPQFSTDMFLISISEKLSPPVPFFLSILNFPSSNAHCA